MLSKQTTQTTLTQHISQTKETNHNNTLKLRNYRMMISYLSNTLLMGLNTIITQGVILFYFSISSYHHTTHKV